MPRNTSGLRHGGPGRPKGAKNKIPRSIKASVKEAYEKIFDADPALIEDVIRRGLRGKPREAFPYVQLGAYYLDGKPLERMKVDGTLTMPTIVNHLRPSAK